MHVYVYIYNSGAPAVTDLAAPTPQPAQDDFLQIFGGRDVSVQGNMPKRAGEFIKTRCIYIYTYMYIYVLTNWCAHPDMILYLRHDIMYI